MKKIYACLCGEWHCLDDDPNCVIGPNLQPPYIWYEEGAEVCVNNFYTSNELNCESSYYNLDYVKIHYNNKDYRINPIFIQIVSE